MIHDLMRGRITSSLLRFALPMMAGNLLQQLYNIADTLIVGRALGNSTSPLWFLGISALLNVGLDLLFVAMLPFGIGGAQADDRIRRGTRQAFLVSALYCAAVSAVIFILAAPLMRIFIAPAEAGAAAVIVAGVKYLHIESACYVGIRLSIPIGWVIADVVGLLCMQKRRA